MTGLAAAQERFAANARLQMLPGEPDQLSRYLSRSSRDKRFGRTITAAARNGKSILKETNGRIADSRTASVSGAGGDRLPD